MAQYILKKSPALCGEASVQRSKNAVLPMMACCLMTQEPIELCNVPQLTDVDCMAALLTDLGAKVTRQREDVTLCGENLSSWQTDARWVERMRASVLAMGPLLARCGRARMHFPGGCAIGSRPIDLHLKGFAAMGARIELDQGCIEARVDALHGAEIYLDFPSVGATENLMMAAALANGTTVLENAAKEPEIVDLAGLLVRMGAKIDGAGQSRVRIEGRSALHGTSYTPMADRIEAGTLMLCAAATGGDVLLRGAEEGALQAVTAKLRECGAEVTGDASGLRVRGGRLRGVDVETLVYPGFPTDLQAPMMAMLCRAEGTSILTEHIFENRFMQVPQLRKMGASIAVRGRNAIVRGVMALHGARVAATDLRAGAALVLAGLTAEGHTTVTDVSHIERGYVDLAGKLNALGAQVVRQE